MNTVHKHEQYGKKNCEICQREKAKVDPQLFIVCLSVEVTIPEQEIFFGGFFGNMGRKRLHL